MSNEQTPEGTSAAAGGRETAAMPDPGATYPRRTPGASAAPAGAIIPKRPTWAIVGAGALGAALTAAVIVVWGQFSGTDTATSALVTRLGTLEKQARELAGRPAPLTVDPKTVDELAARLAKLETTVATPRPPLSDPALANRITSIDNETKVLGERIGVVARRTDEIAVIAGEARKSLDALTTAIADLKQEVEQLESTAVTRAEFGAAANRLAMLERTATEISAELARQAAKETRDRAARFALAAAALKTAVERGDPFLSELAAAKAFAPDTTMLAPLEALAAGGVPSTSALSRDLSLLVPALAQGAGAPAREGGYLQRLQANAEKIVRIRPADDVPGDDPAAIVARIELRAGALDVDGALAELAKLPVQLRAPAQAWIARAQSQIAAIALARRFASEAVAALAKPAP